MIGKLLILTCALAHIASAQRLECFGAPFGYFVPHPRSCAHFFSCVDGHPFEDTCPPGFLFNVNGQLCDFRENTDCISCGRFGVQQIPEPTSCTIFYRCSFGTRETDRCPTGLHFDTELGQCNLIAAANCTREGNGTTARPPVTQPTFPTEPTVAPPTTTTPGWPTAPPQTVCRQGDIFLAHPSDCSSYYLCLNGQALKYTCPPDLLWNPALTVRQCDLPHRVTCLTPP